MTQEQIKEQAKNYISDNLNSVSTIELVADVLDDLSLAIGPEIETAKDKKDFNTLTTIILTLREMIK